MRKFYLTLLLMLAAGIDVVAENWMGRLPDHLYVAQVTIPGAHDAATAHGWTGLGLLVGDATSKTQDITLQEQWALGVRAFDLRPKVDGTLDKHLQCYHGIAGIDLRFDDALYILRDSLAKNPSEFAVVHLLYADGFDEEKDDYKTMLLELLQSDGMKDYVVDFRRDLTVGEMRGKILLMSRDQYDTRPVGAFMTNWCGWIDWNVQTQGWVAGAGSGAMAGSPLYMQDLSDTHEAGMLDQKVEAIGTMLDFSTRHAVKEASDIVWVYNFASGYSKVSNLLGNDISMSDGYRDNATYTNKAIVEYFRTHEAGPAGIVLMDYVGVDESEGYATMGKAVVDTLIANNFKFVERMNAEAYETAVIMIDRLYDRLQRARETIGEECPDVAADFEDELEGMRVAIDSVKAEADSLYAGRLLTEAYEVDYTGNYSRIQKIIKAAREAQEAAGVAPVRAEGQREVRRVYSLSGELLDAPRRGTVNVVEYSDGTVRKVKF